MPSQIRLTTALEMDFVKYGNAVYWKSKFACR